MSYWSQNIKPKCATLKSYVLIFFKDKFGKIRPDISYMFQAKNFQFYPTFVITLFC